MKEPELCVRQYDNKKCRQHAPPNKYGNLTNNIDEVTHDKFWELLGFEDPVKHPQIRKEFEKCKHYCNSKEHQLENDINGNDEHEDTKEYCQLHLWHKTADVKANHGQSITDGHLFNCSHAEPPHMFVLY